jgi:hypothetical protein
MRDIDRRSAVALGLFGGAVAAAAPGGARAQPQQPAPRFAERLVEGRVVLSFATEPEALRRRVPGGWEPAAVPAGPHRGANTNLIFWERFGRLGPDGRPSAPGAQRYVSLVASVRPRDGGPQSLAFVYIRAWTPVAAVPGERFGVARAAEVEREAAERGADGGPATVREAWTVRADGGGGEMRLRLDYRRNPAPLRSPFEFRVISAAEVRPPFELSYRADRLQDVLRSEGIDDPRLARFELEATAVPELREALGGTGPRPRGIVAEPVILRDVPAAS